MPALVGSLEVRRSLVIVRCRLVVRRACVLELTPHSVVLMVDLSLSVCVSVCLSVSLSYAVSVASFVATSVFMPMIARLVAVKDWTDNAVHCQ